MKKIKNGKLVLDGTITQNELQDKVNKAFEIVIEKNVNMLFLKMIIDRYENYDIAKQVSQYNLSCFKQKDHLTIEEYLNIKEII